MTYKIRGQIGQEPIFHKLLPVAKETEAKDVFLGATIMFFLTGKEGWIELLEEEKVIAREYVG